MAIFGEIVLIIFGIVLILWSILAFVSLSAFSSDNQPLICIIPLVFGVFFIYLAIKYGPIIVGISYV